MYKINNPQESVAFFNNLFSAIEAILSLSKPLISAVNGLAYGGGCEILLLSDIVIAVNDAKFSISEGKLGLIPPMASAIGYKALGKRIMRLLLTDEEINVEDAKEIGLVDYVVPKEELNFKILEVVKLISGLDKESIKSMKNWTRIDMKMIEKAVRELSLMCIAPSARDRMRDFIEKRKKS
jgi:enoyl-CoA hydratase/carnithine racemase